MKHSMELFQRAQACIPGGVNSPVRAFRSVGGTPPFIARGEGPFVVDVDGKRYIDYVGSWGPLVAGHAHPRVIAAIQQAATLGTSFGAPTEAEVRLAETIIALVPSLEMIRLVNSGTEATMSAIRLARAVTGRAAILKFQGCYHGHADSLLVDAGSGAATFGVPSSPGVTEATARDTLTLPYNDLAAVEQLFARLAAGSAGLAAIIVEPVAGNMGCVLPADGFLAGLRRLCDAHGTLLIFDEVMTGFRVALGGAQALYGVQPDLTTLGKVIGGGLPMGAYGGKRAFMERMAPVGPVYQAGTLSGNPLATAAGLTMLELITAPGVFDQLVQNTKLLVDGISGILKTHGIAHTATAVGSMFGLFFTDQTAVRNFAESERCNGPVFNRWFHGMLEAGVYLAPSRFEAGFVSIRHDRAIIEETLAVAERVAATL
jgi:glutamate-1-semialdehyde 2,1-aminomutase